MRFFPLFLALVGCDKLGGGEDLLYEIDCDFVDSEVEWDDAAPMGTSAEALFAAHAGAHDATGKWTGGETTTLTATLAVGGSKPVFHELVGGKDEGMCASSLEIPVALTFQTDDGSLDETLTATWAYGEDSTGEAPFDVTIEVDQADIHGGFEPVGVDPNEEVVGIVFHIALGGEVPFSGSVATHVQGDDGETAWDGQEDQLAWPAP